MKDLFIELTRSDNEKVVIGITNIAYIEDRMDKNDNLAARIYLNFRKNDEYLKSIDVVETQEDIKQKLGL
ncbi:MAG: hypothetical protein ACOYMF_05320 [Bacteroidales bacterium]